MSGPVIVWKDGRKRGRSTCFVDGLMAGRVRWDRARDHWIAELRPQSFRNVFLAAPIGYATRARAKQKVDEMVKQRLCEEVEQALKEVRA